ncbi:enoyl-CoA hydratase/isomerase family protein [Dactylosporangium sp. CA-233914]|uniref:enoyl-CoA hydratase/isomerase family protein n=1 Tax=Dactylosporangium sp. CA-233914 TaxID=3239934 RepID=UPI003D933907
MTVEIRFVDAVAEIRLSRPEVGNALDLPTATELNEAVATAGQARSRAILLTGAGRHFCVGGDLRAMLAAPDPSDYVAELAEQFHRTVQALVDAEAVLVCAVDGAAAGAGLALTLLCDLVIASPTARFLTAYTTAGLTPDGGTTWHLPRVVGRRRAADLLLNERVLSADDAVEWGVVSSIADDGDLERAARLLAQRNARPELAATARLLRQASTGGLAAHLAAEAASIAARSALPEVRARMHAVLEH